MAAPRTGLRSPGVGTAHDISRCMWPLPSSFPQCRLESSNCCPSLKLTKNTLPGSPRAKGIAECQDCCSSSRHIVNFRPCLPTTTIVPAVIPASWPSSRESALPAHRRPGWRSVLCSPGAYRHPPPAESVERADLPWTPLAQQYSRWVPPAQRRYRRPGPSAYPPADRHVFCLRIAATPTGGADQARGGLSEGRPRMGRLGFTCDFVAKSGPAGPAYPPATRPIERRPCRSRSRRSTPSQPSMPEVVSGELEVTRPGTRQLDQSSGHIRVEPTSNCCVAIDTVRNTVRHS